MMGKRLFTVALAAAMFFSAGTCLAKGPIHFAFEWGPALRVLEIHHYNYLTDENFRINNSGSNIDFFTNGYALFRAGLSLSRYVSLSVGTGITGSGSDQRIIPALGRVDYRLKGEMNDGILTFAEAGFGISRNNSPRGVALARTGVGYRYRLGTASALELTAGVCATSSHPRIWSDSEARYISDSDVRRNDENNIGAFLGIAIDF